MYPSNRSSHEWVSKYCATFNHSVRRGTMTVKMDPTCLSVVMEEQTHPLMTAGVGLSFKKLLCM
jgi:hypothetical protein